MGGKRAAPQGEVPVDPVSFMFDREYALTEVRVVAAADEETNKYPHALWHLVADKKPVSTKVMVYGRPPKGMKPKVPQAVPEALEPDVIYHIYISAGDAKGEQKFKPRESLAAR
jgi:hypothetical protein